MTAVSAKDKPAMATFHLQSLSCNPKPVKRIHHTDLILNNLDSEQRITPCQDLRFCALFKWRVIEVAPSIQDGARVLGCLRAEAVDNVDVSVREAEGLRVRGRSRKPNDEGENHGSSDGIPGINSDGRNVHLEQGILMGSSGTNCVSGLWQMLQNCAVTLCSFQTQHLEPSGPPRDGLWL
jgi:hypothetical protein